MIKQYGFTLLELLVVMVIIALLVGFVGPRYFAQLSKSEVKASRAQIYSIRKALEVYRLDHGVYPSQALGLNALMSQPAGDTHWHGPYLQKEVPSDPWGNAYLYKIPGEKNEVDLMSLGADGRAGGVGDNADIVE